MRKTPLSSPNRTVTRATPVALGVAAALSAVAAAHASDLPTGGRVTAGAADITRSAGRLDVTQHSQNAILQWQDFSIGRGATAQFQLPNADAAVLNRVLGGNPSEIHGRLQSNGRVFLINPNGVLVGPGGAIQTRGFVASTRDVSDETFMTGKELRFFGDGAGSVSNLGVIEATGGDVVLVGRSVENAGRISAAQGVVALAAGDEVVLRSARESRIWVAPEAAVIDAAVGVDQRGTIDAAAVELKAAGGNVYALAVNAAGRIDATGVEYQDGRIVLSAGAGTVRASGELNARNADGGGGEILVGGEYQGAQPDVVANAATVEITSSAVLNADGVGGADGGRVIVWSDDSTTFQGSISARATGAGGDGGFVEVSGKRELTYAGVTDLSAVNGQAGTLLLDPTDFTLDFSDGAPASGPNYLTAMQLADMLNSASVTIQTQSAGAEAGDIIMLGDANSIFMYESPNDLTLSAHRDIFIGPGWFDNTYGGGDIYFKAGRDIVAMESLVMGTSGALSLIAGRHLRLPAVRLNTVFTTEPLSESVLLAADQAQSTTDPGVIDLRPIFTSGDGSGVAAHNVRIFTGSESQLFFDESFYGVPTATAYAAYGSAAALESGVYYSNYPAGSQQLTIRANDMSRTYGAANPVFTSTYTGFVSGDDASDITGLKYLTDATIGSNVGTYSITPYGASAPAYYAIEYQPGVLTINPAALTINARSFETTYGASLPAFSARVSGLANDDAIADVLRFDWSTNAETGSNVGEYWMRPGATLLSPNYTIAVQRDGSLNVTPAPLTITVHDAAIVRGGALPVFQTTVDGLVNEDAVAEVLRIEPITEPGVSTRTGTHVVKDGATVLTENYTIVERNYGSLVVQEPGALTGSLVVQEPGATTITIDLAIDLAIPLAPPTTSGGQSTPGYTFTPGNEGAAAAGQAATPDPRLAKLSSDPRFAWVLHTLGIDAEVYLLFVDEWARRQFGADSDASVLGWVHSSLAKNPQAKAGLMSYLSQRMRQYYSNGEHLQDAQGWFGLPAESTDAVLRAVRSAAGINTSIPPKEALGDPAAWLKKHGNDAQTLGLLLPFLMQEVAAIEYRSARQPGEQALLDFVYQTVANMRRQSAEYAQEAYTNWQKELPENLHTVMFSQYMELPDAPPPDWILAKAASGISLSAQDAYALGAIGGALADVDTTAVPPYTYTLDIQALSIDEQITLLSGQRSAERRRKALSSLSTSADSMTASGLAAATSLANVAGSIVDSAGRPALNSRGVVDRKGVHSWIEGLKSDAGNFTVGDLMKSEAGMNQLMAAFARIYAQG